jgi:hypothetical protein
MENVSVLVRKLLSTGRGHLQPASMSFSQSSARIEYLSIPSGHLSLLPLHFIYPWISVSGLIISRADQRGSLDPSKEAFIPCLPGIKAAQIEYTGKRQTIDQFSCSSFNITHKENEEKHETLEL